MSKRTVSKICVPCAGTECKTPLANISLVGRMHISHLVRCPVSDFKPKNERNLAAALGKNEPQSNQERDKTKIKGCSMKYSQPAGAGPRQAAKPVQEQVQSCPCFAKGEGELLVQGART